jgi:peptidoglycan hydrolase-like protein with peptidoglycan-binding domain
LQDNYVAPVATTSAVLPASSVVPPSVTPSHPASTAFTQFLYAGLRSAQVKALQSLLVARGYLLPTGATGFFGNLTLHALQQFQCAQKIVCTGGAGWGTVGPKTRSALNGL